MERTCDVCGTTYVAKRAAARYCSDTCRKRAQRAGVNKDRQPAPQPEAPSAGVYAATLARVTAGGVEGSESAQAALVLAARIDAGLDSGASIAAMVRQLHATMAVAMENAERAADPIDELRRRRAARRASA